MTPKMATGGNGTRVAPVPSAATIDVGTDAAHTPIGAGMSGDPMMSVTDYDVVVAQGLTLSGRERGAIAAAPVLGPRLSDTGLEAQAKEWGIGAMWLEVLLKRDRAMKAQDRLQDVLRLSDHVVAHGRARGEVERAKLASERDSLDTMICSAIKTRDSAEREAVELIAKAKLSVAGPPTHDAVVRAVEGAKTEPAQIAGEYRVAPTKPTTLASSVLHVLCTGVIGGLVAVCLGSVSGLIRTSDVRLGRNLVLLGAMWLIGTVVVALLAMAGKVAGRAMARAMAQPKARDGECEDGPPSLPADAARNVAAAAFLFVAVAIAAELGLEAIGLYHTHVSWIEYFNSLLPGGSLSARPRIPLPVGVFVLVAGVISLPWVAKEIIGGLRDGEAELVHSWLMSECERRQEKLRSNAGPALKAATEYDQAAATVRGLQERKEAVTKRLDSLLLNLPSAAIAALNDAREIRDATARAYEQAEDALITRLTPPEPPRPTPSPAPRRLGQWARLWARIRRRRTCQQTVPPWGGPVGQTQA